MDETLEAELHAAQAAARRRRSLRDVLLAAEDRRDDVVVAAVDGQVYRGSVAAVGSDHVELCHDGLRRMIAVDAIVAVTLL
jgi:hypothetical protein